MPEMQSDSNTKLDVSKTITIHLRMGGVTHAGEIWCSGQVGRTHIIGNNLINKIFKSIHPAEMWIFPHHPPPVPILMNQEDRSADKKNASDIC